MTLLIDESPQMVLVSSFDPVRRDSALYQGTVWIDKKTFARVRVQAVQGGLPKAARRR